MEHIYLKENAIWASDKEIHLESYFNECSAVLQDIFREDGGDNMSKLGLKKSSEEAVFIEDKKSQLKSHQAIGIYTMFPKVEIPSYDISNLQKTFITNQRYEFQSECIKSTMRRSKRAQKQRSNYFRSKMASFLKYNDYRSANHERGSSGTVFQHANPSQWQSEVLLELSIFPTSTHQSKWLAPQASQIIQVLGSQELTCLGSKIRCINNYTDVAGDISEDLSTPAGDTLPDKINSSMLYLGNTFYIDGDKDYSEVVKSWGKRKKLHLGDTQPMTGTRFKDLKIRLHYPYLYQHLGDCEHTVMITEARFLELSDKPNPSSYPIVNNYEDINFQRCYMCANFLARWIVRDSERMVYEFNPLCDICFKQYHYVKNKKIGNFQAYRILLDKDEDLE